ncbi:MAG TPA: Dyp-type peroxidase [Corynebacterium sp.]|nr:Dyp-type peroxidase [Corynebacterium sp.]
MSRKTRFSRRSFFAGVSTAAAASTLAACASASEGAGPTASVPAAPDLSTSTVTFDGLHQAGVDTPAQAHLNLVGFNLKEGVDRDGVIRLMRSWSEDARALTTGQTPPGSLEPELVQRPANLTVTCGFGPRIFDVAELLEERPEWLGPIPEFQLDQLDEAWGQSDLVLQICSDDPLTVSHTTRHMVRTSPTYAVPVWMQQGFLHAAGTREEGQTPRNLFGQKDGTVNPRTDEELMSHVWHGTEVPDWSRGGTAMVVRRVELHMDTWEMLDRASREESIGRTLEEGGPLSGGDEFAEADYSATDDYGLPFIDPASHMARARPPVDKPEQVMLRRPYNYDLPPVDGISNSGQVFICFQQNPDRQFTPVQARLDEQDRLNEWITHIGSAVYWIPPGTGVESGDDYWGQRLLEKV